MHGGGKPRQPTNILALKAAFKNDPKRLAERADEPDPAGPPPTEPPAWMTPKQKEAYAELLQECHASVMCQADVKILVVVTCLWVEFQRSKGKMEISRLSRLTALLCELGMTPASRSKVKVLKPKDSVSPFAKFG